MVETVFEGKYLKIVQNGHWEYVTRKNADGAVIIVPLDGSGKYTNLIMISEFRVPFQKRVLGFPAGLVGDKTAGEDIFAAARREMVEEVGLMPNSLKLLCQDGPSSSGLTDETFDMILAQDLVKVGDGGGDETEDIEILSVPLIGVTKTIDEHKSVGTLISPKVYMALYFLLKLGYDVG